jgi:putative pyruvate formate lyase activating enzyme
MEDDKFAATMVELQAMGCHNVNLVTLTHVLPQILAALPASRLVCLFLVYNCGGYEDIESLRLLDGIVDIIHRLLGQ